MSSEKKEAELEENLNDALLNTYFTNLAFLREHDFKLYQKVEALTELINTGRYKERYALEFIKESGDFDIYDMNMKVYLYNRTPKKYNQKIVDNIKFDTKAHFTSLVPGLYNGNTYSFDFNPEEKLQEGKYSSFMVQNDIKKYYDILGTPYIEDKKLGHIDKFMFIGTLLGRHIFRVANKIKAKSYFICEPNLEIFRLSLFVLNLVDLAEKSRITLSIMDDDEEFFEKILNFLYFNFMQNHTIKYYTTNYHVKKYFSHIANAFSTTRPSAFNYNMILFTVLRNNVEKLNNYNFLDFSKKDKFSLFKETPVLYLAAGPSLDDNIQWIKENQNRFIIVTISATLKRLKERNIIPDMVINLDSNYTNIRKKQFTDEVIEFINDNNIIVLASTLTAEDILKLIKKENIFIYEALENLKSENVSLEGWSVGDIGFKILYYLNAKEIYLLGTDLALNQEDGFSHIKADSSTTSSYDLNEADEFEMMKTGTITEEGLLEYKGNFDEKVWTTRSFFSILESYNKFLLNLESDMKVYNLSNHGVYINKTIPLHIEELDVNSFKMLDKKDFDFNKNFEDISFTKLDEKSIAKIKEELIFIDEIIEYIDKQLDESSNTYKEFSKKVNHIFNEACNSSKIGYFIKFIQNYMYFMNPYIDYHFNEKKIKKSKLKEIEKLWLNDIKTLTNKYKKLLEKAIV